jgi:hypothetical protein
MGNIPGFSIASVVLEDGFEFSLVLFKAVPDLVFMSQFFLLADRLVL